jgi:alanine dehydrogenase
VLVLRNDDCVALLTVEGAMDALKDMLREQAAGKIEMPERLTVDAANGSWLRLMPAIHNDSQIMGFKTMNLTPNAGVHYWIALIDITDGRLIAQLDADYITTLRTSATAAIATELYAPAEIETMALLGTSTQAAGLVDAMAAVRAIPRINVFSPNPAHREAFAERVGAKTGIDVRAVGSAEEAIRSSNLVCSAYRAGKVPQIVAADLRPGSHVNGLSSVRSFAREVADDVWMASTSVVVDHRAGVADSGDGLSVTASRAFDLATAPELFEAVRDGKRRQASDGITLFKSVGAATQDIAVALLAYRLAVQRGVGQDVANFPEMRVHLS